MEPQILRTFAGKAPIKRKVSSVFVFNAGTQRSNECTLCESSFDSETEVEVHKRLSHKEKYELEFSNGFGCTVCQIPLRTHKQSKEHLERNHLFINNKQSLITQEIFICDYCDIIFFNKQVLLIHVYRKHNIPSPSFKIQCPMCPKWYHPRTSIQHMDKIHTRSLKFCPICMEKQEKIKLVPTHANMEHPVALPCAFCSYVAKSVTDRDAHLSQKHKRGGAPGRSMSPLEARGYFTMLRPGKRALGRLQFPERGIDITSMAAVCVLCQKVVYSEREIVEHMREQHGHSRSVSAARRKAESSGAAGKMCDCGARFTTEVLLKHHIFKVHTLGAPDLTDYQAANYRKSPEETLTQKIEIEIPFQYSLSGRCTEEKFETDVLLERTDVVREDTDVLVDGETGQETGVLEYDHGAELITGDLETNKVYFEGKAAEADCDVRFVKEEHRSPEKCVEEMEEDSIVVHIITEEDEEEELCENPVVNEIVRDWEM